MRKILIITAVLFLMMGCKILVYKKYAESLSVSFGSGGGFTGAVDEFILSGNGQLKSIKSFSKDTIVLKSLSSKEIKKIFKMLETKSMDNIKLETPGNMTSFIYFSKAGKITHKYQWPEGSSVPKEIAEIFKLLCQLSNL